MPDEYKGEERRAHSRSVDEVELAFDRKLRYHALRSTDRYVTRLAETGMAIRS